MDRVRFGRALGFGARAAMKTLVSAVDAATAENPSSRNSNEVRKAPPSMAGTVAQAREAQHNLRRGGRRFGEAVWGPLVRLWGVLWLEVSGVFFGVFALLALGHLWKLRGAWHSGAADAAGRHSLMAAVAMLAVFGYFCVSSFVRARRRERRR